MPIQEDIELIIKSRLESEGVDAQAAQLAQTIGSALERSFEEVFRRVFDKSFEGLKQQAAGLQASTAAPRQIVDPSGQPVQSTAQMAAQSLKQNQAPLQRDLTRFMQSAPISVLQGYMFGSQRGAEAQDQMLSERNFQSAILGSQARSIAQARKAGVDIQLTPEEQKRFGEVRDIAKSSIGEAIGRERESLDEIIKLQESIKSLRDQMQKGQESEEKRTQQEKEMSELLRRQTDLAKDRERNTAAIGQAVNQIGAINQILPEKPSTFAESLIRQVPGMARGGIIGTIGLALREMGRLPIEMAQREAAGAEVENFQSRALMRGDLESYTAINALGGQGGLERKARTNALLESAGNIGIGAGLGFVAGGLPGAVVGGGLAAYSAYKGFNRREEENMGALLQAELKRSEELKAAVGAAGPMMSGAFRGGRGMGAGEFAKALMGTGFTSERELKPGEGLIETQLNAAARMGIRPEEFQQQMAGLIGGGAGGMFGMNPNVAAATPMVGMNLSTLTAAGLQNAGGLAAQMFQGGATTDQGTEKVRDIFERAVQAGLDRSMAGKAMQIFVQQATQGIGGATGAQQGLTRALGAAQELIPGAQPGTIGPGFESVARMTETVAEGTQGTTGIKAIGGMMQAEKTIKDLESTGVKFKSPESRTAMMVFLQRFGKTMSAEALNSMLMKAAGVELPSEKAGALAAGQVPGAAKFAETLLGEDQAMKQLLGGFEAGAQTAGDVVPPGATGTQARTILGTVGAGRLGLPQQFTAAGAAAAGAAVPEAGPARTSAEIAASQVISGSQVLKGATDAMATNVTTFNKALEGAIKRLIEAEVEMAMRGGSTRIGARH